MNRSVLLIAAAGLLLLAAMPALAQNNVTFQVKMNIKMEEGAFQPGSGDVITVRGSFNGWGAPDTLSDIDGDSTYTGTMSLPEGDVNYKFYKTLRGGLDWESDPNRVYTVVAGDQSIPAAFFDRDSVYTPPASVDVTFQVNMRVKLIEQTFQPGSGDIVRVAGNFNGWGGSTDTLTDPNNDSIYTKTLTLTESQGLLYKFLKSPRGGIDWEGDPNRAYTVQPGAQSIPADYFDRDSIANVPVSGNILWHVDMNAYETLGWFRPDLNDTVQVRGGFNSWGGTAMQETFVPGQFEVALPYNGGAYDDLAFKFFMNIDSANATARFNGYTSALRDGMLYDHPAERGDGNRIQNLGPGGDITPPIPYFSSINPNGLLSSADTVDVTIQANMGPAMSYLDPFDPVNDTAKLVFQDALWLASQRNSQGSSYSSTYDMTPIAPGDSVYAVTVRVVGPTHYNLQYRFRYVHAGGAVVDQSGGLGGQNLFISRFIQPSASFAKGTKVTTVWPRLYTAPVDTWQKNSPFYFENPPFDILSGVQPIGGKGVPKTFALSQNYPNPFNPATKINYEIPERSHVTLKIFNLLGQEVLTLVNENQAAGRYVATFDASRLATGVYFYKLEAGDFAQVKKMVLAK